MQFGFLPTFYARKEKEKPDINLLSYLGDINMCMCTSVETHILTICMYVLVDTFSNALWHKGLSKQIIKLVCAIASFMGG